MSKTAIPHINPAKTWITADSHFGHRNIIDFCARPDDHEEVMVMEWENEVPKDATVLHLGDLSYRNNAYFKNIIAPKLTGERKLLVKGNHDRQSHKFYRDSGFKLVSPFSINYKIEKQIWRISFDHYPFAHGPVYPQHLHIHGHIHNNGYCGKEGPFVPFSLGQINVSVEQMHYRPVNLKKLLDGYLKGAYA